MDWLHGQMWCFWEGRFWVLRRAKKALKTMRNDFRLYEDVLPEASREALETRLEDVAQAIRCAEEEDLPALVASVQRDLDAMLPRSRFGAVAEWFDILVSALSVAFCIRAYYYEPFQIPTGSMQPTLYGIHVEESATPTAWDRQPLRLVKWLVTGERFVEVRAKAGGAVVGIQPSQKKPGYVAVNLGSREVLEVPEAAMEAVMRRLSARGMQVRFGERLWSGYVKSGDFLFVNRWLWNFRHPRLGETMVFSTQGIRGLPQNQHYIKRLCGRPGDEVAVREDSSYLWVGGKQVEAPLRMQEIAEHCQAWKGGPSYLGYQPAKPSPAFPQPFDRFVLGAGEYVALGDNSGNSLDSRYWGTVPARNLLGPASFVHWPFTSPRWGRIR